MIDDARRIADGTEQRADVCIIGAGAAGVTAALELATAGKQVILLEAGGRNRSGKSLELYQGELVDPERHLPLDKDRYRQLGGTTSLWGGRCLPLDPIDLQPRDYVPHSGWPISWETLESYFERAHQYCECGRYAYRTSTALPDNEAEMVQGFQSETLVTDTIERWSPPTHFGKRYRGELEGAQNLRVLLHAVCCELLTEDDGSRIRAARVSTFRGTSFEVSADTFILAGGGLEATRLLMVSKDAHDSGIGNHSGWLGRGYMCHLAGVIARVRFPADRAVIYAYEVDDDEVYCRRRFWIGEEAQRREGLLNTHFLLDRPLISNPEHGSGILSLAFFAKNMSQGKRHIVAGSGKYALYWSHTKNIFRGSPEIMSFLPQFFRKRFVQGRRIPSLLLGSRENSYYLYYHAEQSPSRDCGVSLSEERDALGVPRLRMDYRIADEDVASIVRSHEVIARELEESGCGELKFNSDDPAAEVRDSQAVLGHHIGTTRMSADPSDGVVDADCRVHGLSNLYVASSSVFPTSGQANPTLTIVAMTLRLTDHLVACSGEAGE